MSNKGFRRAIITGAVLGAAASLAIALSLDYLFSDTLQNTWWEAAHRDATKLFGPEWGESSLIIGAMLGAVMLLLAAIGAVFGIIAGAFFHRFLEFLFK